MGGCSRCWTPPANTQSNMTDLMQSSNTLLAVDSVLRHFANRLPMQPLPMIGSSVLHLLASSRSR